LFELNVFSVCAHHGHQKAKISVLEASEERAEKEKLDISEALYRSKENKERVRPQIYV
jgi:hypothetical protein